MCCCARYAAAPCAPQRHMKRLCWPHTPNTKFYWIMFMLNSIRFTLTTGALVLLLAGCAVGPQYQRPSADVPKAFKEATLSPEAAQRWTARSEERRGGTEGVRKCRARGPPDH